MNDTLFEIFNAVKLIATTVCQKDKILLDNFYFPFLKDIHNLCYV